MEKIGENLKQRDISIIKVSVIIPFFNRIEWTCEAIKSVLNQTHKNLEIIVINDFSTDNVEMINKIAKSDDRIRLVSNKRQKGVSGARNTGIDIATGEYIAFLDSDDLFSNEKIEKQLEFMVRGGFLFSHTSYSLFSDNLKEEKIINSGKENMTYPVIIVDCFAATPTIMIHTEIFKNENNRFIEDFSIGEDTCLWIKLSGITPSMGIDIVSTRVRRHQSNAAYDNFKQIQGMENILEYLIKHFLNDETVAYIHSLNNAFMKIGGTDKRIFSKYNNQLGTFRCDNLQVSDNDLIGNKFNGHDLHLYLREKNIDSKQLVWNKESLDDNTFKIARNNPNRNEIYRNAQLTQKQYALNGLLNPTGYDILLDPLFINAKLVHFHLIHNSIFDIQLLPLMSRLKPIVWTLHDPWALGGHCIHHFACEKWKKQCGDCPKLKAHFGLQTDNSALNFALKKDSIRNSNFEVVVASKWMKGKVEQSPIFEGKKINVVPFGINQKIFRLINKNEARKQLGILEDALVILFRCDYSGFKGMNMIEYVLKKMQTNKKVILLVLKSELKENIRNFNVKYYGWVKDDELLAQIYSAADLFLMPSTVESFGMMAIEAMSCGTLPIVLDGTALPDTVNAPNCGVSTKRNKDDYLRVVQYYIDNENERNDRAKKCLKFARANYNKDVYVSKIIKVYGEARVKHRLSEEDQFLLDQLKKYAVTNAQKVEIVEQSGVEATRSFSRLIIKSLLILLLKYKNIVPKKIRNSVRSLLGVRKTNQIDQLSEKVSGSLSWFIIQNTKNIFLKYKRAIVEKFIIK